LKIEPYLNAFFVTENTKLVVALGNTTNVEVIDLNSPPKVCSDLKSFPFLPLRPKGGLDFQNNYFICGGRLNDTFYTNECRFHFNNSWNVYPPMNEARYFPAITRFPNPGGPYQHVVTGGLTNFNSPTFQSLTSVEVLTADGWKSIEPLLPVPLHAHCMVALNSTHVMVIGGIQNLTNFAQKTFILDLAKSAWSKGPSLKVGRNGQSCTRIATDESGLKFSTIVIGGMFTFQQPYALTSVELLDDGSNEWRQGPGECKNKKVVSPFKQCNLCAYVCLNSTLP
jgi:hypothetical protein